MLLRNRLTSEATSNAKSSSPPSTPAPALSSDATTLDFKGCILSKPHVNENNNLTNGCGSILGSLRSQSSQDPLTRLSVPEDTDDSKERQVSPADEDDVEEEEEDSRSSESKPPLSPILSAPTTIRFPAREPEKDRQQATDSGVCRWDKCEESFESSGELLEHLQVRHFYNIPLYRYRLESGRTSAGRAFLSDRSVPRVTRSYAGISEARIAFRTFLSHCCHSVHSTRNVESQILFFFVIFRPCFLSRNRYCNTYVATEYPLDIISLQHRATSCDTVPRYGPWLGNVIHRQTATFQVAHINTQTGGDNFVCQWQGCKVQGRSSCSRRWLERHVLSHGGNKPFRCIVDGCGSRFSSQVMPRIRWLPQASPFSFGRPLEAISLSYAKDVGEFHCILCSFSSSIHALHAVLIICFSLCFWQKRSDRKRVDRKHKSFRCICVHLVKNVIQGKSIMNVRRLVCFDDKNLKFARAK